MIINIIMEANRQALLKLLKKKKVNIDEIKRFVRDNELEVDTLDSTGMNVLHHFIMSNHLELINYLFTLSEGDKNIKPNPNVPTSSDCLSGLQVPLTLAYISSNDNNDMYTIIRTLLFVST